MLRCKIFLVIILFGILSLLCGLVYAINFAKFSAIVTSDSSDVFISLLYSNYMDSIPFETVTVSGCSVFLFVFSVYYRL